MEQENRKNTAKQYARIHNWLFLLDLVLTLACLVVLISGGKNSLSAKLSNFSSSLFPNLLLKNGIYIVLLILAQFIFFLPLSFYEGYTLEHKFKLSNHTIFSWLMDKLKGLGVSLIITIIILEAVYFLLGRFESTWWIWASVLWIFFTLILNHLAPIILLPIFYKLTPLKDTEFADKLRNLAEKAGAKILGVYEFDLSKKTKKANAAFTGIGNTKRILLADTLIKEFSKEEIEVILAHELGHYYFKHLWKLMALGVTATFIGLFIVDKILKSSVMGMGFENIANIGAFPVFALVMFGFMLFTMPINNTFSRMLERQADKFAIDTTNNPDAFMGSMRRLSSQNLSDDTPNPIIHFLLHSHPSISERIRTAETYKK